MRQKNPGSEHIRSKMNMALTMTALAIIALATATYAWFTLSLSTNIKTMELQVTAGVNLRVDTTSHTSFDQYKKEIDSKMIENQLGYKLEDIHVDPLTSANGVDLYLKDGKTKSDADDSKKYLQFNLYFMGSAPMDVYLTTENSDGNTDGTKVESASGNTTAQKKVEDCVRVSFQEDGNSSGEIYQQNDEDNTKLTALNKGTQQTFTKPTVSKSDAKLFSLDSPSLQKKVTVRIWIEGDDSYCTDDVKEAKFLTQLRFEGKEK